MKPAMAARKKSARHDQTAVRDCGLVPLEAILCTEELWRRPRRAPDDETENRALARLMQALAETPRNILQMLADTVREVLKADSAGMSLIFARRGCVDDLCA